MFKRLLEHLYRKRDKERYSAIKKRWEVEQLKAEIEKAKRFK